LSENKISILAHFLFFFEYGCLVVLKCKFLEVFSIFRLKKSKNYTIINNYTTNLQLGLLSLNLYDKREKEGIENDRNDFA